MEMRKVYANALEELMEKDDRVCLLDADLGKASGTMGLREKFPDRIYDCGIAEQNMASIAAGLSSYGFKPWIESFTPFATRRICDQVAISIVYAGQNVKIVGTDPGISAEINGGTHQGTDDVGTLRSIPGLVIFEPVDEVQLKAAMPVLNDYGGSVYMRLFRKQLPVVFPEDYKFDLFRADTLRAGTDVSIFVTGLLTADTVKVAEELAEEGISCEVINVHTIKPVDREAVVASARKTGCAVTVENHNIVGGLHSAILEALTREKVPVVPVGIKDRFGQSGKPPVLFEAYGLTDKAISAAVKRVMARK